MLVGREPLPPGAARGPGHRVPVAQLPGVRERDPGGVLPREESRTFGREPRDVAAVCRYVFSNSELERIFSNF